MGSVTQDASMDAAKVAPNLYKVIQDTLGLRILSISYKPGESSVMHSHPDAVLYVIDGGKGEFTAKDGTKSVRELKSGMSMITPADTHSVKNVGNTTLKAILVEVARPKK
jgi:quercetin dioxygenase-like cupin family protein